jgi:hypothetical protein
LFRTSLTQLLVALLALIPTGCLHAQRAGHSPCGEDSEIVFARVLMDRLCQVAKEPAVFAATGAKDANQLMATLPPDIMWRVEDGVLVEFIHTYSVTLERANAQTVRMPPPSLVRRRGHKDLWLSPSVSMSRRPVRGRTLLKLGSEREWRMRRGSQRPRLRKFERFWPSTLRSLRQLSEPRTSRLRDRKRWSLASAVRLYGICWRVSGVLSPPRRAPSSGRS